MFKSNAKRYESLMSIKKRCLARLDADLWRDTRANINFLPTVQLTHEVIYIRTYKSEQSIIVTYSTSPLFTSLARSAAGYTLS